MSKDSVNFFRITISKEALVVSFTIGVILGGIGSVIFLSSL